MFLRPAVTREAGRKGGRPLLGALLLLASICGCQLGANSTWTALFTYIPESVHVETAVDGTSYYVCRQTHEPLFRHEDGQNYVSRVLSAWSRNLKHTEFKFCPKERLVFEPGQPFSPDFLEKFLSGSTKKYGPPFTLERSGACSVVRFSSPQPGYLNHLSRLENSPSISTGNRSSGLGPYRIENISKSTVLLQRKTPVSGGYNRIEIRLFGTGEKEPVNLRKVSDFNKLSSFQQPDWVRSEYAGFDNIELRVVGLAINHPDPRVRKVLYNCINPREFRKMAVPSRKDFYDIQTVLPLGVPGALGGTPPQTCSVPSELKGTSVIFANSRTDNYEQMTQYALEFKKRTGIELVVKNLGSEEVDAMLLDPKRRGQYNLALIVTYNARQDQEGFFVFYVGANKVIGHVPANLDHMLFALERETEPLKKKELAERLADDLGEHALALPLYQTFARLYYPPGIKNLSVGRGFEEIPDIGDLRW